MNVIARIRLKSRDTCDIEVWFWNLHHRRSYAMVEGRDEGLSFELVSSFHLLCLCLPRFSQTNKHPLS